MIYALQSFPPSCHGPAKNGEFTIALLVESRLSMYNFPLMFAD